MALGKLDAVVLIVGRYGKRPAPRRLDDLREIFLRQGEDHTDRRHLRDHDEPRRIGGVDDVALINQADAGAAHQRRGDRGIAELHARVVDHRLVMRDRRLVLRDQRFLGIDALAGGELLDHELL
jgi:hypothetical protein